jgi:hypothetical protein
MESVCASMQRGERASRQDGEALASSLGLSMPGELASPLPLGLSVALSLGAALGLEIEGAWTDGLAPGVHAAAIAAARASIAMSRFVMFADLRFPPLFV